MSDQNVEHQQIYSPGFGKLKKRGKSAPRPLGSFADRWGDHENGPALLKALEISSSWRLIACRKADKQLL
jgi:hypothetical protein